MIRRRKFTKLSNPAATTAAAAVPAAATTPAAATGTTPIAAPATLAGNVRSFYLSSSMI